MKLIDNWKKAWRMASVQVAAGAIAFGALPETVQGAMLGAVGLPVTAVPVKELSWSCCIELPSYPSLGFRQICYAPAC